MAGRDPVRRERLVGTGSDPSCAIHDRPGSAPGQGARPSSSRGRPRPLASGQCGRSREGDRRGLPGDRGCRRDVSRGVRRFLDNPVDRSRKQVILTSEACRGITIQEYLHERGPLRIFDPIRSDPIRDESGPDASRRRSSIGSIGSISQSQGIVTLKRGGRSVVRRSGRGEDRNRDATTLGLGRRGDAGAGSAWSSS